MIHRSLRTRGLLLTAGVAVWALLTYFAVPALIRATHAGHIPLLGRLMPGLADHPVEGYLRTWEPIGRASVAVVATLAMALAVILLLRGQARRLASHPVPAPPAGSGGLILIACWLGLLFGLGEAWYILQRTFYRDLVANGLLNASQHAVWMSPLAVMLVLGTAGVLGALLHRLAPSRVQPRDIVVTLVALGLFGLILATGRLHWAAAGLLGLGVATRVRTAVSPGAGELVVAARRSTGWLFLLLAGLGGTVLLGEWWRERQQLATAGSPAPGAPNVLFIVLDTERAASTSLHGNLRRTTPFLEELASRGVWFERAIAPSSWTLPSHAAMFTGKRVRDLPVNWHTPLAAEHTTIAEVLARRGYATAGFVANQFFGSVLFGLDQGFGHWQYQPVSLGALLLHSWLTRTLTIHVRRLLGNYLEISPRRADAINSAFLEWLDKPRDRPFFAFLNYFDAHAPYQPPPPFDLLYTDEQPRYWLEEGDFAAGYSATDRAELQTAYETGIAYLDDRLRRLFDALEARSALTNTVVIVTSDHGEVFGENGRMGHTSDLVMPLVHVPLIMIPPGGTGLGTRVSNPVELRHVAATVLALTGTTDSRIEGSPLDWRLEGSPGPDGGESLAEEGPHTAIVTGQHQLILDRTGPVRLFDHRADPLGLDDLSSRPEYAALVDSLTRRLREIAGRP